MNDLELRDQRDDYVNRRYYMIEEIKKFIVDPSVSNRKLEKIIELMNELKHKEI